MTPPQKKKKKKGKEKKQKRMRVKFPEFFPSSEAERLDHKRRHITQGCRHHRRWCNVGGVYVLLQQVSTLQNTDIFGRLEDVAVETLRCLEENRLNEPKYNGRDKNYK